ncbi:MAG: class I SAM-dependent methyltransferase [Halioglobus sp.]
MRSKSEVVELYSTRTTLYQRFVNAVAYPRGIRAYFEKSDYLKSQLHVLDAGCGSGIATFALRKALLSRGLSLGKIRCFDITPDMLDHFRENLRAMEIEGIETIQADVLNLESLPEDWRDFDLITSAAMMEYLPADRFFEALAGLRSRLSSHGVFVLFITRDNLLTRWLIRDWWKARCYTKAELERAFDRAGFSSITFSRFPHPYKHLSLWGHIVEAA